MGDYVRDTELQRLLDAERRPRGLHTVPDLADDFAPLLDRRPGTRGLLDTPGAQVNAAPLTPEQFDLALSDAIESLYAMPAYSRPR